MKRFGGIVALQRPPDLRWALSNPVAEEAKAMNSLTIQVQTGDRFESIPLTRAVRPTVDVVLTQVGDELVLLNLGSEQYFGLDSVGRGMWQRLTTASSISDAVAALLTEYDVDRERLLQDVAQFLGELISRNLVELCDAQAD